MLREKGQRVRIRVMGGNTINTKCPTCGHVDSRVPEVELEGCISGVLDRVDGVKYEVSIDEAYLQRLEDSDVYSKNFVWTVCESHIIKG